MTINPIRLRWRSAAVTGLLLFLVSFFATRDPDLSYSERIIFDLFQSLRPHFDWLFVNTTHLGSPYVLLLIGAIWLLSAQLRKSPLLREWLLGGGLALVLTYIAKLLLGRPRPQDLIDYSLEPLVAAQGAGFPSGHTAFITVLALGLMIKSERKFRIAGAVLLLVVATSRLYLGVHAPLDLVGGFAIGLFSVAVIKLTLIEMSAKKQR